MVQHRVNITTSEAETARVGLHMLARLGVVGRMNSQPPNQPGDPGPNPLGIEHRAEKSLAV